MSIQRSASLIGRSLASGAGSGVSWSPPSPSLQDDPPMAHSVLPDSQEPILLEKEAVGEQILSSQAEEVQGGTGTGGDIKTETLEDD